MFFLFLVPHIISKHFDKDLCDPELKKSDLFQHIELYSRDYDSATITLPEEMALMLIKWDDAIVEFNFIALADKKRYTFTKEIGLSLFAFKEKKVLINISFKSDISFYVCPLSEINTNFPIIHFNNMKRESFQVSNANITQGIAIVSIFPFMLSSSEKPTYLYYDNKQQSPLPTTYTTGILCIRCINCFSDPTIYTVSYNDAYPTIPTVVELEVDTLLDRSKKLRQNFALGNNNAMEYIERLNNYKYVFLKNEITDTKKYKLFVTDVNNEIVELKKGEVFRRAIIGYSNLGLSIASKNCQKNDIFSTFSGNPLEINDDGEIVIESFTDNDIPNHCRVNDSLSPGIIAAIVIAVVVVVAAIIVGVIIFIRKKKSHSSQEGNSDKSVGHTSLISK